MVNSLHKAPSFGLWSLLHDRIDVLIEFIEQVSAKFWILLRVDHIIAGHAIKLTITQREALRVPAGSGAVSAGGPGRLPGAGRAGPGRGARSRPGRCGGKLRAGGSGPGFHLRPRFALSPPLGSVNPRPSARCEAKARVPGQPRLGAGGRELACAGGPAGCHRRAVRGRAGARLGAGSGSLWLFRSVTVSQAAPALGLRSRGPGAQSRPAACSRACGKRRSPGRRAAVGRVCQAEPAGQERNGQAAGFLLNLLHRSYLPPWYCSSTVWNHGSCEVACQQWRMIVYSGRKLV
ncbi:translation initiation factor IF-2-like [Falco biarmicus]|uniref:translation initiation factor IF-2-like n=1 Tax=Falco biarmicus TaxID=345155 RepID=UPI0024BC13CB|nr:translation initiation factor IF-2-like [Falco biarmicus]